MWHLMKQVMGKEPVYDMPYAYHFVDGCSTRHIDGLHPRVKKIIHEYVAGVDFSTHLIVKYGHRTYCFIELMRLASSGIVKETAFDHAEDAIKKSRLANQNGLLRQAGVL